MQTDNKKREHNENSRTKNYNIVGNEILLMGLTANWTLPKKFFSIFENRSLEAIQTEKQKRT